MFSFRRLFILYGLAIISAVSLLSVAGVFDRTNLFFIDWAFQLRGEKEPLEDIVVVAISQKDFELGAPRWPWPRSLMARLVDQISRHGPSVIAIDILFTEPTNSESVLASDEFEAIQPFLYGVLSGESIKITNREGTIKIGPGDRSFDTIVLGLNSAISQDQELADAVRRAKSRGVDVLLAAQTVSGSSVVGLTEPYPALAEVAANSLSLVGIRTDSDGTLRNYIPFGRDREGRIVYSLAVAAASRFTGIELPQKVPSDGNFRFGGGGILSVTDSGFLVNFPGPPGTYKTIIARDILKNTTDVGKSLKGKIVFVGVTDPSAEDLFPTPFSGTNRMSGVEFHAAAAGTLLRGNYLTEISRAIELLTVILAGLAAIFLGRFLRPFFGVIGMSSLLFAILGLWIALFNAYGLLMSMTSIMAVVSAGYIFSLVDRVGLEQLDKIQARAMLSRYLAPEIVKEMLKNPEATKLGGRRSDISVLFSDIRGFTSLSERLLPEEVVSLLNDYLEVMTEVIFEQGGTIDKFEGDAILAFFGAPRPQDDHADRAIMTALEMRRHLDELEAGWIEKTGSPLRIGIGINSGHAIVGNIGSQRKMDYTIIGDTVNLASRLQDLTKEYNASIIASGATLDRAGRSYELRPLGTTEVRGRSQQTELFEVLGLNQAYRAETSESTGEIGLATG